MGMTMKGVCFFWIIIFLFRFSGVSVSGARFEEGAGGGEGRRGNSGALRYRRERCRDKAEVGRGGCSGGGCPDRRPSPPPPFGRGRSHSGGETAAAAENRGRSVANSRR